MTETQRLGPLFADMPISHRNDAVSSFKAADRHKASDNWSKQRQAVLKALQTLVCATAKEISEFSGIDRYIVSRKLPDLRRAGVVENGKPRKCRILKKKTLTWQLIDTPTGESQ